MGRTWVSCVLFLVVLPEIHLELRVVDEQISTTMIEHWGSVYNPHIHIFLHVLLEFFKKEAAW